ncbi:MAG: gamma-glutamyl-gamma-aminobutyrate hydrolase family protein [Acidimicrobiia bacterium]
MKPVVGITTWRRNMTSYFGEENLQTLAHYYIESLRAIGITPLMYPAEGDPKDAGQLVDLVDGVVLSGGQDVDPALYGAENTHSRGVNSADDRFEIALVEAARERNKPLLAICRGIQVLNVALGGTLRQEVTSPGGVHELIDKETDPDELVARRHVVRFEKGARLAEMYGADEAKVNTIHHQGIDRLAGGLVVEGRTDDGLIEAVRYGGNWWALGVQWHPERLDGDHQRIFALYREAVTAG